MDIFESNWDNINHALTLTVQLVSNFGFSGQNLSAHNAILPVAYYLYRRNPGETYLTHSQFAQDRQAIREWLIRSLLKSGVWGSGLDTLLTALRRVIEDSGSNGFPVAPILDEMARRGKSLVFEQEELEELTDMEYGNGLTFALSCHLFSRLSICATNSNMDHIFPRAHFTERKLRAAGVADTQVDDFMQCKDRLANLQLLDGALNNEKRTKMPAEWLSEMYTDSAGRNEYEERQHARRGAKEYRGF